MLGQRRDLLACAALLPGFSSTVRYRYYLFNTPLMNTSTVLYSSLCLHSNPFR